VKDKTTLQEDRINVWKPLLNLVADYPLTGTGGGTLGVVEPIVRQIGGYPGVVLDHAHNEYLEALVEGGIPRLAITLLMVFWLVRMGMRGIRRHRGEPSAMMPTGLLFGLLALAIHSIADFGVHMGSVALLATVCLAHLSALSRHTSDRPESHDHEETSVWVLDGLVARLGGMILAVWALLLVNDLATGSTVFRLQLEADQQPVTNAGQERRIELLESASRLRPWLPEIHETIGLAALDMVSAQDTTDRGLKRDAETVRDADLLLDVLGGPFRFAPLGMQAGQWLIEKDRTTQPDRKWSEQLWNLGLSELAKCRALSPVYRRSHAYLGLFADRFQKSEPASAHLYRAAKVYSFDPDLWYSAGLASWMEGEKLTGPDAAKKRETDQNIAAVRWRESLRRSTAHLPDILARSLGGEQPAKLLDYLLPDDPGVLLEAIKLHKPDERRKDPRPSLLETARQELLQQAAGASPGNWKTLADLQQKMGEPEEKIMDSLRKAAVLTPVAQRAGISLELARRLEENGLIDEAQRMVDQALQADPESKLARELERVLRRDRELAPYLEAPQAK
jgi:tetratricopeptide (TPR) repeat protein/energy-converting hydrogenase Eha subunit A